VVISIYNTRENILAQLKCFQPSGEIGKSQSAIKASAKCTTEATALRTIR